MQNLKSTNLASNANLYRFYNLASSGNVYTFTTLQAVELSPHFAKLLVGKHPKPFEVLKIVF